MIEHKNLGWLPCLCLALTGAVSIGCGSSTEVPVGPATGLLTVNWTLDGSYDPGLCYAYGAGPTDFELLIYRGTSLIDSEYAPCEDFTLSVELYDDVYTGLATLVEPDNDPVTTSLPLDDLDIVAGTELTVDVDFPPGSVL